MSKHLLIVIVFLVLLLSIPFLTAIPQLGNQDDLGAGAELGGEGLGGELGDAPDGEVGNDAQLITAVAVALANPSFEQGVDAPANWTPLTGYVDDQYVWGTGVVSAGTRSISIHYTRWEYGRWSSDALTVEDDGFQWYALTGNVKALGNNGEVYLSIAWLDKDGAMITTSDSAMLPAGDNDWSTVTVSALPPSGAVTLNVWCISNHNAGQTWFDALALTRTHFPAAGAVSYEQFLVEQPTHPLAVEANVMQVQALMTEAKWTVEEDFYNSDGQLRASRLYAEAADISRQDTVYGDVFTALHEGEDERTEALSAAKDRFDGLINETLWNAAQTAAAGGDTEKAQEYLATLSERGSDIGAGETAGDILEDGDENLPDRD